MEERQSCLYLALCFGPSMNRRCQGRHGICSRTGKYHVVVSVTNRNRGVLWIRRAQVYPGPFAAGVASLLVRSIEQAVLHNMVRLAVLK